MVVVVTGYKQSGKDTTADYLVENYGFVKYAFADPIRDVCRVVFDWGDRHFFGDLKEEVDPVWGISPRRALQWIGTEAFQWYIGQDFPEFAEIVGRTVWVKKFLLWHEREKHRRVVIPDMRFHHELDTLEEHLGNDVRSVRINNERVVPNDVHASEQDIPDLNVDFEVENHTSFEDLYEQLDELVRSLP
jgi:hypothetical protein